MSPSGETAAAISAARPPTVARMFGRIAPRYDLLNSLMTFGMDADWRRRAVAAAAPPPDGRALDVGTGTGSLALALAAAMPRGQVVGVDFAAPMLARAPARHRRLDARRRADRRPPRATRLRDRRLARRRAEVSMDFNAWWGSRTPTMHWGFRMVR